MLAASIQTITTMTVPIENLDILFADFVEFIKQQTGDTFASFQTSVYIDRHENYKYEVSKEAKESLDQKHWKEEDIGTGKIQQKVNSAIQTRLHYKYQWHDNNLVDWRKKDDFAKRPNSKPLEQTLFDFYKNKIKDDKAFETFLNLKISYQFIAYLFFIKDSQRYLPITQERFDQIFELIGLTGFKTSGQASWENYTDFININKQVRDFLKTKDPKASLLDAHSFLYILGSQMKAANFTFSSSRAVTNGQPSSEQKAEEITDDTTGQDLFVAEEDDEISFPEGKEIYRLHKSKERNKELIRLAKERHLKNDEKLSCQVCGFSFVNTYGEIGHGFIEAHHIFPISELTEETATKIEDLALVCSNCHRMLHRRRPWLTIDNLKAIRQPND
ncbi:MAG: HNH endonuclease [Chitinophagaceae bacterium]|nr:HNH endonuclease [Chitinophagaceae bacterium]